MSEHEFLNRAGWADAAKTPLAGDASSRRYTRLTKPNSCAILMDEGPASAGQLDRFAAIAKHLKTLGLSAPEILADGSDQFLLLEDLGDAVFARVIADTPAMENPLYNTAIDALIVSQHAPIPSFISPYGPTEMAEAIMPAFEWYPTPQTVYPLDQTADIKREFQNLLTTHLTGTPVLIQRDFHAENLIWLPDREGPARAGLLDFQDAVSGHRAYDIASLLVDARRDVSRDTKAAMIDYYTTKTCTDATAFKTAFALCSAQRNLRILGIFAGLAIRDNKPAYVALIPRVWRNLNADLEHPVLAGLRQKIAAIFPKMTDDLLTQIKAAHV